MNKLLLSLILLAGCAVCHADILSDQQLESQPLTGISKIMVAVVVNKEATEAGLSTYDIRRHIDTKLRKVGIVVDSSLDMQTYHVNGKTVQELLPILEVDINGFKSWEGKILICGITVSLEESCTIDRTPFVDTTSTTWTDGSIDTVGMSQISTMPSGVDPLVTHFCNDYLIANPVTPHPAP